MRYLTNALKGDLKNKAVLLSGPRQCGKTTLAKSLLSSSDVYLNWDIRADQRVIRQAAWKKDAHIVALDELHRMPKWKNFLKGLLDESGNKPSLLVTGSARLDAFRKAGDPLTGRTFFYRLHPIDLNESRLFAPALSAGARLKRVLECGGFPESFMEPENSERLRNDRFDQVIREDLRDLSNVGSLRAVQLLLELLRERVGGVCQYANLAEDVSVSPPSIKRWVQHLEDLYLIFLVTPYTKGLARGTRKAPKIYFFDAGAAVQDGEGGKLENLVACALLKFVHYQRDRFGKNYSLHYFRDREKREVDFVVALNRKPYWCIEVKQSDDSLHLPLRYLHERLAPHASFQLVRGLSREKEIAGVKIVNLERWLEALF